MNDDMISYPELPEAAIGSEMGTVVTSGVHWLRMPLFSNSAAINCWALEDDGGWTIVDSGLHDEPTETAWSAWAAGEARGKPVRRVFATHMHPDHAGMAGWLVSRHKAVLWMTRPEYLHLHMIMHANPATAANDHRFFQSAGMDVGKIEDFRGRDVDVAGAVYALPPMYRALSDGGTIRIGSRNWVCITGCGHSPEHACLWSPEDGLLLSGDQILPEISSNVSVLPLEPFNDPLSGWLASLQRIRAIVPDNVLVLPAHGRPFFGLHKRIDDLLVSHERKMERALAALDAPRRIIDLFPFLFRAVPSGFMQQTLAIGEAFAHLACLRTRGLASVETDAAGVLWWRRLCSQAADAADPAKDYQPPPTIHDIA